MVVLPEPGNPVSHITGKWSEVEVTDEVVGLISIYLSSCFLTRNLEPDQRSLQGNFRQFDILFLTVTLG